MTLKFPTAHRQGIDVPILQLCNLTIALDLVTTTGHVQTNTTDLKILWNWATHLDTTGAIIVESLTTDWSIVGLIIELSVNPAMN